MLTYTDSSGKLLYNFASCYLASGNLWLSFRVRQGIQITRGEDGKCVLYHKCSRNNRVYFWVPIRSRPFRCVTKGLLRTPEPSEASSDCFSQCVRLQDAPILPVRFPDADKWASDWVHQQHGIWMKDDEMEGRRQRRTEPVKRGGKGESGLSRTGMVND